MFEQPALQIALLRIGSQHQEVELVGVFGDLLCQIRLRRWKSPIKVGHCPALALMEGRFDLVNENVSALAVLDGTRAYQARTSGVWSFSMRAML